MLDPIYITVSNRIATITTDAVTVSNNTDQPVVVTFDDEWDGYDTKTIYVVYGGHRMASQIFTGAETTLPAIPCAGLVEIGFSAGNLRTSTGARKMVIPAVTDGRVVAELSPSQYDQIMERIDEIEDAQESPDIPTAAIEAAIEAYFDEHPIPTGGGEIRVEITEDAETGGPVSSMTGAEICEAWVDGASIVAAYGTMVMTLACIDTEAESVSFYTPIPGENASVVVCVVNQDNVTVAELPLAGGGSGEIRVEITEDEETGDPVSNMTAAEIYAARSGGASVTAVRNENVLSLQWCEENFSSFTSLFAYYGGESGEIGTAEITIIDIFDDAVSGETRVTADTVTIEGGGASLPDGDEVSY